MAKVKIGKFRVDEKTLEAQHKEAVRKGNETLAAQPRAVKACYDNGRIAVDLSNGCTFIFPPEIVQGLAGASSSDLKGVEILAPGLGLHWEKLDADFSLPCLMAGIFGTKAWMAEAGRQGGCITTDAKARAARENGAKGGRPRKQA